MSLLLDALRQAEKNNSQTAESSTTGLLLSVEQGIEEQGGEPISPLSLTSQDRPANTTDEWVEIALMPAFDLMPDVISSVHEAPIASFYEPEQNDSQADITEQANGVSPDHPQPQAVAIEQDADIIVPASEAESGSPAPMEQASSAQASRHLAESVLFAAQKPDTSKIHLILLGALVGLMAVAAYLYWLTLPPTPVYTASAPATQPVSPEPSTPAVAETSVNDAVVMETADDPAQKREGSAIDTPAVPPVLSNATPSRGNSQPKPTVADVMSTPDAPESSYTDSDDFIVESPDPIIIKVHQQPPHTETYLNDAYQLYQKQDYVGAAGYYRQVLRDAPNNIDALLGMGAVAERLGDKVTAESYFKKVQTSDNSNTYAGNALIRLEQSQFPAERESNYQGLLEKFPDAAQTHAALGDLYAEQERWSEAQQAYFNAAAKAPDNAEYHYNLAVSLDHLGKGAIARRYYQQALQLGKGRQVSFDSASVYLRLQQLPEQ